MTAFESLRHPDRPVAPDRSFAERLRRDITAALSPTIDLPNRSSTMTTTDTATAATTTPAGSERETVAAALSPYLAIDGAARAIDWYATVFAATETTRYTGDDGRIGHAEIEIGGSRIMVSDEYPDFDAIAPTTVGATSVTMNLNVPDVDAVWERAIANGADGKRPPEDQPYGERSSTFVDPFGHRWMVQTTIASPSVADVDAAMEGFTVTAGVDTDEPAVAPVEIGYVTLGFDDTRRAIRFYGELFGWQAEAGNAGEGYAHVANTRMPLGFTPAGSSSMPELYFRVGDADAAATRVVELGGAIINRDAYDSGASVVCDDDQGRRFVLWQPAPGY